MPKGKTKKIVSKRFKVSKTGKVMHRKQGARHLRRNKSKSRQRRQDKPAEITNNRNAKNIKRLLGIG
jgi:large subunit ribosomal protein L35